jgi:hypothetical protein
LRPKAGWRNSDESEAAGTRREWPFNGVYLANRSTNIPGRSLSPDIERTG